MDITEILKEKIELLREHIDQITEDEEHLRAQEWHYYKIGVSFGEKLGQLNSYKEFLSLLES
nr:hypothetical protein [Paenibacillus xylanexedens]